MPIGWRILLYIAIFVLVRWAWVKWLVPMVYYLLSLQPRPLRRVRSTDNSRFNRHVVEGFIHYGPRWIPLVAGMTTGLLIPVAVTIAYGLVVTYFLILMSFSKTNVELAFFSRFYMSNLADDFPSMVNFTLGCLACGIVFALGRNSTVARYIRNEGKPSKCIWESELWGVFQGWLVYWLWAMWPRGTVNFCQALRYVWLWVGFGALYGWYFRAFNDFFIWMLVRKRWTQGVDYVARRVLAAWNWPDPVKVMATADGTLYIDSIDDSGTRERLNDLLNYLPGVTKYISVKGKHIA